jgi:ferric-dicitrate binding protein FerR (iron transport regulator)
MSQDPAPERLGLLIDGWLDGALPPHELDELNQALRAEPEATLRAQEQLRTIARLEVLLAPPRDCAELVARTLVARDNGRRASRRSARLRFWLVAVAAVLMLGCIWLFAGRMPTAELLQGRLAGISTGGRIRAGETVDAEESALLRLPDGSRLRLSSGARLTLVSLDTGAQRMRLDTGTVDAEVEHQLPGAQLSLATSDMDVTVIGTRFSLEKGGDASVLAVRDGRVRCQVGTTVREVGAGGRIRASGDAMSPLAFRQGDPIPQLLAGVPAVAPGASPSCLAGGFWKNTPGMDAVTWEWPPDHPLAYRPDMILRGRVRCAPGVEALSIVVYIRNRTLNLGWDRKNPATGEWFDLHVPLADLYPYRKAEPPLQKGDLIGVINIWVDRSSPQALLVDDVRIESDLP